MNINFELTAHGQRTFLQLTRGLAHRGAKLHRVEHFAIAVRGRVYSRPSIDYRLTPDGLDTSPGVSIANVPPNVAKRLADALRGARR
jgi:preprotein translocase subunit SecD